MKKIELSVFILIFGHSISFGQDIREVIHKVKQAQANLRALSYSLDRTDTLLTDEVRTMSGQVKLQVDSNSDNVLGFKFWAKKDAESEERLYDGYVAYTLNPQTETYTSTTSKSGIVNVSYSGGGGHLIFRDLVHLDTTNVAEFKLKEDHKYYYLTLRYADYVAENVSNRFKLFSIDKNTMLPVAMKNHQESYGKIQDLYYKVSALDINRAQSAYDFKSLPFLDTYKQQIIDRGNDRALAIMNLKGAEAPAFRLNTFWGGEVSSESFKDKVVLIDLWEIWCGPCIASMSKVESLYEKYKDKGLLVYGISNDARGLSAAKNMVQRKGIKFPMLIGNEQFKKDYHISTIVLPMYLLIDKSGKLFFLSNGFSDEIETEIMKAL